MLASRCRHLFRLHAASRTVLYDWPTRLLWMRFTAVRTAAQDAVHRTAGGLQLPGLENPDEFGSLDPSYRETVVAGYQFLEVQYIEIKYLVFSLSIEVAYVGSGDSHDPLSTVQAATTV